MGLTLTNSDVQLLADLAIGAYQDNVDQLNMFALDVSDEQLVTGDIKKIAVYSITDDSAAFNISSNNYETEDDNSVVYKDVTIDTHLKKTFGLTDQELMRTDAEKLSMETGRSLAKTVTEAVYAKIVDASFSTVFTGIASTFDSDDISDIRGALVAANWDISSNPFLVVDSTYITNLLKDGDLKDISASGSDNVLRRGEVGTVNGLRIVESTIIPGNGENLVGFASDGSGLAIAMAVPAPPADQTVVDWAVATSDSGLSLMVRKHYAPATGKQFITYECIFGSAVASTDGIKRLESA